MNQAQLSTAAEDLRQHLKKTLEVARQTVFGQDEMLEAILAALVCQGHVLIEGMPGLGKTLSVSTIAKLCELTFKRIQFTPDLLPSDLIGTMVYNQSKEEFNTKFGPIFTQILLADEINRSPAKVQAALLEAMAERQVTIGETSYKLKEPFVVLATQNPIEQEGTYTLPEAQLDRFMMKVQVNYPAFEEEKRILTLRFDQPMELKSQLTAAQLKAVQQEVDKVYVDEKITNAIVKIVHGTRPNSAFYPKEYQGMILSGASPRATIWLYRLSKFKAFIEGKTFVTPEHIMSIAASVIAHRLILSYESQLDQLKAQDLAIKIAGKYL